MTARVYKDKFTLDGRLKPQRGLVTEAKVRKVKELLEAHKNGSAIATATLSEALTTSDAAFNLAYLANLNFIPNYDEADREWRQIAGTRTVSDLKPVTLYSLNRSWTDGDGGTGVLSPNGAAPVIPEGTAYPYAYISGEVAQGAGVVKRGFKTDWTLEARINDGLDSISRLPDEMLEVSLDTEAADVWGALVTGGKGVLSQLDGGTLPDGTVVTSNSPLTRGALIQAQIELGQRQINGRRIQVSGGYHLIVPVGRAIYANWVLNQTLGSIVTNTNASSPTPTTEFVYSYNGPNPLDGIEVIESEWVTGTEWFLKPKPNATRRPILERLDLRGYQTPQLMVENNGGVFVAGGAGAVSPFEGSFDADVITLKLRQFGGGVLWDNGAGVVYSKGDGSANA